MKKTLPKLLLLELKIMTMMLKLLKLQRLPLVITFKWIREKLHMETNSEKGGGILLTLSKSIGNVLFPRTLG